MTPTSLNRTLLTQTARALGPLLTDLVFVGGATVELLLSDPAAPEVRFTQDVDAIIEVASYGEYQQCAERLRAVGFFEDVSEGAPHCRWRKGDLVLDVMPTLEEVLGFANRWYSSALWHSTEHLLETGLVLRVVDAPHFVATKHEAFLGRGAGDYRASHDLEDILLVVDGRPELHQEARAAPLELKTYLAELFTTLLNTRDFVEVVEGFQPSTAAGQARADLMLERMAGIARL